MEIYLIRHTTPDVKKGVCYGQTDLELSGQFEKELDEILLKLPDQLDAVITSPLTRCCRLAEKLPSGNLRADVRLKELNFGSWEMMPWNQIPPDELNLWMADFVNLAPPGGESVMTFQKRVLDFWEELFSPTESPPVDGRPRVDYQSMAIVTHAGVIRILWAHLNAISLKDCFSGFKMEYGHVWKVEL